MFTVSESKLFVKQCWPSSTDRQSIRWQTGVIFDDVPECFKRHFDVTQTLCTGVWWRRILLLQRHQWMQILTTPT